MHYLVRFIVEADTAEGAKECTRSALDDLYDWHEFDYYVEESSESRWEDCWQPVRLNTKQARAMVRDAMHSQYTEFTEVMTILRHMIDQYSATSKSLRRRSSKVQDNTCHDISLVPRVATVPIRVCFTIPPVARLSTRKSLTGISKNLSMT